MFVYCAGWLKHLNIDAATFCPPLAMLFETKFKSPFGWNVPFAHRMFNVIMNRTVLLKYSRASNVVVTCCGDTSSGMWNSPTDTPSAIIWRLSFHSLRSWNSIEENILSYFFLIMQFYGVSGTFVSLTT
jgi:hypothetical protein